jgi:hypothetical protein
MNHPAASSPRHRSFSLAARAIACAGGLLLGLGFVAVPVAFSQQPAAPAPAPAASPAQPQPAATGRGTPARVAASGAKGNSRQATHPLWRELNPAQQQALAPLAPKWDTVSDPQKRKWLAMSENYPKMSGAEQAKLHSRMSDWVSLSPQQRTQARLNFGETQKIPVDDKKAKWEAYQALSAEEKRKFAAGVAKPPTTAAAVKPVAPEKLATVPKLRPRTEAKTPRIAAAPNQVDHNTLLPQPPPAPTAPIN